MNDQIVGRPMEILLVEDNLLDARLVYHVLGKGNFVHRLTLLRNGSEAVQFVLREGMFARAPRPDLVLLDLRLPGADGLELLRVLKEDDELRMIPVVIMTGSESAEDMLECTQFGVEHYITKPINLEKFMTIVKDLRQYWRSDVILPTVS
jgi:CheY-like chemotaxis protein